MSECPVCYEEINASTGVVTLSCTHSYHFSCISSWFLKNDKSNCPCCRKEMLPIEDFVPNKEDSSEDEDDEDDDDDDDQGDDILFLTPQGMIDLLADHGCYIPRTASEGSPVSYNMQQFNQICVMGGGRAMTEDEWNQAIDAQVEDSDDESVAPMPPINTEMSLRINISFTEENSWERAIEESDEEMRQAAVKVQSAWREFKARQEDNIVLAAMILASMDCE